MVLKFLMDMSVNIAVFRDTKTCRMAVSYQHFICSRLIETSSKRSVICCNTSVWNHKCEFKCE